MKPEIKKDYSLLDGRTTRPVSSDESRPPEDPIPVDPDLLAALSQRLGSVHARLRLGIETEDSHAFGHGIGFFHPENLYTAPWLIRMCLRLTFLYGRAQRNARDIRLVEHTVELRRLPAVFDGMRILQISDPHVDMSPAILEALIARVRDLHYDVCVLTGDYRAATYGAIAASLDGMRALAAHLKQPSYGVLGNHDSIRMVPELEAAGIRMLINEAVAIQRGRHALHIAGIDDAHYFRVDNIAQAAAPIPAHSVGILLSHTPEVYRQAAHAGFDLMLCGHTHGGQLCLPGGIPVLLDAKIPRRLGRGRWHYQSMVGYTSVGAGASIADVRLNCPPEVTLHTLRRTV
jgi:uncharacterized protein